MAQQWLPVPDSIHVMLQTPKEDIDLSLARPVVEGILAGKVPNLPQKLSDFPSLRSYGMWLSRKVAAELGFVVGSASGSFSFSHYVQQLTTWKDVPDASGTAVVRYGISARYIVSVEEIKASAKLNSIGGIAASASYENLRASAEFSVLGVPAAWLIGSVPTGGAFDLNKYVEFEGALRGLLRTLHEKQEENLLPQILEVRADVKEQPREEYEEPLAIGWALTGISRRIRLNDLKREYEKGSARFQSVVETIYTQVARIQAGDEKPSPDAERKAKEYLNGLRVDES